jgi:hypothetical protein
MTNMEDITEEFRKSIPYPLREALLMRNEMIGETNFMNSRIVSCNSLEELAKHYGQIKPCYAYVHALRFRDPEIAYGEFIGEPLRRRSKKREFMLQDRYGKEWCWAEDNASWFRPKIKEIFYDYEVLDVIFGKVDFTATFSGPTRHIRVISYKGRIPRSSTSEERELNTMPSYVFAHI